MTPDAPQQPSDASRPPAAQDPQPTEVLPAVDPATAQMPSAVPPAGAYATEAPGAATAPEGSRSPYKLATWILGILVVVLVISVIAALATRGGSVAPGASPSPSPSPSVTHSATPAPSPEVTPTPSPSETPEEPEETTEAPPPPPPPGPVFTSFSAPASVTCADEFSTAEVTLSWASTSATAAWVGIATDNAKSAPYSDVPTSGSVTLPFPCSNSSQLYTVTLEDADGLLKHRSTTVTRSIG